MHEQETFEKQTENINLQNNHFKLNKTKYEEHSINEDGDDEHEEHTEVERSDNKDLTVSDSDSILTDSCYERNLNFDYPNTLNESQKKLENLKNQVNSSKFNKKIDEKNEESEVKQESWLQKTSNIFFNFFKPKNSENNLNKVSTDYTDSESDDISKNSLSDGSELSQDEDEENNESINNNNESEQIKNIDIKKNNLKKSRSFISFETKKMKEKKNNNGSNSSTNKHKKKTKNSPKQIVKNFESDSESSDSMSDGL